MERESGINQSVRDFIARHIKSVEQLEILLLLYENHESPWSVSAVFQKIQSNTATIKSHLEGLKETGFVVLQPEAHYRFSIETEKLHGVKELAEAYREKRVRVIEAIYCPKPDAARQFADAFKFKKKEQ